jgi:hypothetical protein
MQIGALSSVLFAGSKYRLNQDTPIKLKTLSAISSATQHPGDRLEFEVTQDIKAPDGDTVLIRRGTKGVGTIASIEPPGRMGKAGKIEIAVNRTRAVDGQLVPLTSQHRAEGKDEKGNIIASSVLTACMLFPVAPFLMMSKGGHAKIEANTEVQAYVDEDMQIEVEDASDNPVSI